MGEVVSTSVEATERAAALLARRLIVGNVVEVSGELGSGKTSFIRGACRALGVEGPITSPTYTIGHRYEGRLPVSHLDLYRLERVSSAELGDLEPLLQDAVVFIEWPAAGRGTLPAACVQVRLAHLDPCRRLIDVEATDPAFANLGAELDRLVA